MMMALSKRTFPSRERACDPARSEGAQANDRRQSSSTLRDTLSCHALQHGKPRP
jgi:hypothetical protein